MSTLTTTARATGTGTGTGTDDTAAPVDACAAAREQDLGWHLGVLAQAYRASIEPVLEGVPHGTRGYQVLGSVVQGDQPSQLALAERHGIDRTVMTYLVDDLVAAGLVERQQNPADRRARRIVATEAGRRRLTDLGQEVRDAEDALLGALSPAERHTFRELARRVACDLRDPHDAGTDPCAVEV